MYTEVLFVYNKAVLSYLYHGFFKRQTNKPNAIQEFFSSAIASYLGNILNCIC